MKYFAVGSFLVAVCVALAGCSNTLRDKDPANEIEISDAWERAATPGKHHIALAPLTGSWNTSIRSWSAPHSQPSEANGTSQTDWILGGRFLKEQFQAKIGGKPFNGLGLIGYDNVSDHYASMWVDSMTTTMMMSEGTVDATGTHFEFTGSYVDPLTKETRRTRSMTTIQNPDKRLFEMFEKLPDHTEFKTLEILYVRRIR